MEEIQKGIYSKITKLSLGVGYTAKDQETKNYFLAEQDGDIIQVKHLDMDGKPLNFIEQIETEEFNKDYSPEPDFYEKLKSLDEIQMDRYIDKAAEHYNNKEYNSAEYEYNQALQLDEDDVRANFGVGKVYLATGELEKASAVFLKVSKVEAVFEEGNKHIFNELGMELRRMKLFKEAITFYNRALSFIKNDENLYYNIGRACYEGRYLKPAVKNLRKALEINPELTVARSLLQEIARELKSRKVSA